MSNEAVSLLEQSALVVAHPDDEVLWFSSVLDGVDETIICFRDYLPLPKLGKGRKSALDHYPLSKVTCLEIEESESFNQSDFTNPEFVEYGIKISGNTKVSKKYKNNYKVLLSILRKRLAGYKNIITHNPWGEYGHEDHIQVYSAVKSLQKELGYNLWYSGYCSNESANIMFKLVSSSSHEYITLPTNTVLAQNIANLYMKNDCWTWFDNYKWFDEESFISDKLDNNCTGSVVPGRLFPVNMVITCFRTSGSKDKWIVSRLLGKLSTYG